ncbi:MAG: Stk1 family PASTA domain-containing Ser/Thr kinase [Austwickia sp.]|nr:MAG: Stk1 family PASTA domain-containing Ser/Thr kinase [Austwickia sp.]
MEESTTQRSVPINERVLVGRYQVGELIGRGGMAEVHAGWDTRLGREVAVKVLRSDLARDPSFLQRFRREAQSAAGLNHPSIVAVYDSGEDVAVELGGASIAVPFIVMERVHGRTLRELLHEAGGPLPQKEACRVVAATLRALAYSHTNGLVHRDIKPANVMVTDDGKVKLTDFGIARAIADSAATMTNTSVVVGTAQYLSPEQAQGQTIDARADVYAAGCVLYELLTGRPPFTGDSPLAIAYQHVGQSPQPPSTYNGSLSREVDAVVLHALAKAPADRYPAAGQFAADLEALVAGRPPSEAALATLPPETPEPAETLTSDAAATATDAPGAARAAGARAAGGAGADADGSTRIVPAAQDGHTDTLPVVVRAAPTRRRKVQIGLLGLLGIVVVTVLSILLAQGKIVDVGGVTVPDVRTKTLQEAQDQLTGLGLAADVRYVANRAAKDTVVRQNPEGGAQAAAGSRVRLDVSSGPGNVQLQQFAGYQLMVVESTLTDQNLKYTIERVESFEYGQDTVVGTEPKAGTTVTEGSSVKILVSNGKVVVPDLRGKTEDVVRDSLRKITLKFTPEYVDGSGAPGTVTSLDFVGVAVNQGSEVKGKVIRGPIPTVTVTRTYTPPPPTPRPTTPTTGAPTTAPGAQAE